MGLRPLSYFVSKPTAKTCGLPCVLNEPVYEPWALTSFRSWIPIESQFTNGAWARFSCHLQVSGSQAVWKDPSRVYSPQNTGTQPRAPETKGTGRLSGEALPSQPILKKVKATELSQERSLYSFLHLTLKSCWKANHWLLDLNFLSFLKTDGPPPPLKTCSVLQRRMTKSLKSPPCCRLFTWQCSF